MKLSRSAIALNTSNFGYFYFIIKAFFFKHDLRQGQKVFIGNCHKFRSTKVYEVTLPSPSIEILDKFCLLPESYLSVDESNKPSKISNYTQILADLNLLVGVIASFVESFSYFINSILSNVDLL